MAPSALAILYATDSDVEDYLSTEGVDLRLDDDNSGTVSPAELSRLTVRGLNVATARVNLYCSQMYDASGLATSWMVNEWTTCLAACWLCRRRGNPIPQSIADACDATMHELELVKDGSLTLTDIGMREAAWPAWSNVTVRPEFQLKKVRVQRQISERSPTDYPQTIDYPSEVYQENGWQ